MSYQQPHDNSYGQQSPQPQYPQAGYPPQPYQQHQSPQPDQYQQQYQQQQYPQQQDYQQQQQHQQQQQQQPIYQEQPQPYQPQPEVHEKQPQNTAPMQAEKGAKHNHNNNMTNAAGEQEWENGMCDCCSDGGICVKAYFCPCMTYSQTQYRLRHDGNMDGFSNCNGPCCGWACLTYFGCQWILSMIQRGDIRTRYNKAGSGCGDCMRHCFCACCSLIQEEKETRLMEERRVNNGGYKPAGGMDYAPQH